MEGAAEQVAPKVATLVAGAMAVVGREMAVDEVAASEALGWAACAAGDVVAWVADVAVVGREAGNTVAEAQVTVAAAAADTTAEQVALWAPRVSAGALMAVRCPC